MKIQRVWAMPNKWTFTIKPIRELLIEEVNDGLWIDPFCGENSPAKITNDLNPERKSDYHLDALDFLKSFKDESVDGVLFDPPYSPRQVAEAYKSFGIKVGMETTQATFWSNLKVEIARITRVGGKAICFGWTSQGIGKKRGFKMDRILLVPHGGHHNDTICTVELKV